MTPGDIENAWSAGSPTRGAITLTIPPDRQNDDPALFEVVAENFRILGQTASRSFGFIDPAYTFVLMPSEEIGSTWTVHFQDKAPASDALALIFTAFYNLALDQRGELYTNVAIDAAPDVMVPHRRLLTLPALPPMTDEETGEVLGPDKLASKQDWGVVLEFPAADADDLDRLDTGLFRLSNLVEAGCFDIPGKPPEPTGIVEPFVGHIPETGMRTAGLRGFRGDGTLVRWLAAFTAFSLNRPLGTSRVVFFPDDR